MPRTLLDTANLQQLAELPSERAAVFCVHTTLANPRKSLPSSDARKWPRSSW